MHGSPHEEDALVSYLTLRRAVGAMGVLLPPVLALGCILMGWCRGLEPSISAYYGTGMRDVMVGTLFAIGWFLFAYRGYDRRDDLAGNLACGFAIAVALFPTTSDTSAIRTVHWLAATGLFLVLAYFSLVLFTKTDPAQPPTPRKRLRNRIYKACGVIMLACIALIALYALLPGAAGLASLQPVFWLESAALWAFGVSWFVKGETVFTDHATAH